MRLSPRSAKLSVREVKWQGAKMGQQAGTRRPARKVGGDPSSPTGATEFEFGLDLILDGLERLRETPEWPIPDQRATRKPM